MSLPVYDFESENLTDMTGPIVVRLSEKEFESETEAVNTYTYIADPSHQHQTKIDSLVSEGLSIGIQGNDWIDIPTHSLHIERENERHLRKSIGRMAWSADDEDGWGDDEVGVDEVDVVLSSSWQPRILVEFRICPRHMARNWPQEWVLASSVPLKSKIDNVRRGSDRQGNFDQVLKRKDPWK